MSMAILNGAIETIWALGWAEHVEECGCQSLSGVEITDVMPPFPEPATEEALAILNAFEAKLGKTVSEMYADAMAMGDQGSEERFGACLVYDALGHGVAWSDDHGNEWTPPYFRAYSGLSSVAEDLCGCMDHER